MMFAVLYRISFYSKQIACKCSHNTCCFLLFVTFSSLSLSICSQQLHFIALILNTPSLCQLFLSISILFGVNSAHICCFSNLWIITFLENPVRSLIAADLHLFLPFWNLFHPVALPLSSLRPPPSSLPSHTLCLTHTYCLPARSLLLGDRQRATDCSYENDICLSWSHDSATQALTLTVLCSRSPLLMLTV